MRRPRLLLGAALGVATVLGLAPRLTRLYRSWPHRVAVAGHSMAPTLHDGDWLLVDPVAYTSRPPAPGELCVAIGPDTEHPVLVKRAEIVTGRDVVLVGDHPAHRTAVAPIGPLNLAAIVGRPWFRYWPIERFGPIR